MEYIDEAYFQTIDYEQIPFRCRKCHKHGHLIREFPLNKPAENPKEKSTPASDGFVRPIGRHRASRKNAPKSNDPLTRTVNTFEILGEDSPSENIEQTLATEQQTIRTEEQSNQSREPFKPSDSLSATSEGKAEEEDEDMVLSELGTEESELGEILEKEGLDLNSIVEQWKQKGIDKIPEEEINRVNYLFLTRQDAALKGMKQGREATKGLGVKSQTLQQT